MRRLVLLAASLSLAAAASAQERAVDAPTLSAPRPVALPSMQPLSLSAPALPLAVAPGALPGAAAAPALMPEAAASHQHVPEHVDNAAPALPASAVPAAAVGRAAGNFLSGAEIPRRAASQPATNGADVTGSAGSEAGALAGERLFDNALERGSPLTVFPAAGAGSAAGARYAAALAQAQREGWAAHGAAVADAALALLSERGVKAERRTIHGAAGRSYDAVTIAAEKGRSPLNDLAYELSRGLGASVDFVPERTAGGASAAYNARENRLMLAGLDRPDFFLAALHEARHAWYSALLRRGDIRLFHLQAVAYRGRAVAPGAQTYVSYLSFEELSTFPKTLKHMLTERARLDAAGRRDAAAFLEERLPVRARQFADIVRSADFIAGQLRGMAARRTLSPRRMSEQELSETDLEQVPGLDIYEQTLPQGALYLSVPQRRRRGLFGGASVKSSAKEARAMLALRGELLGRLTADLSGPLAAYYEAVGARDWAEASRQADRLIKAVKTADDAWQLKTSGRS